MLCGEDFFPLEGADNPPNGSFYAPNGSYYPLKWIYKPSNGAYYPMNWMYHAPNETYYPPDTVNNALNVLTSGTELIKLDERPFANYFKSLGALQNAWMVVVPDLLKAPAKSRWNQEVLETMVNVGHSITAIFAVVINYQFSVHEYRKELDHLHTKIADFIVTLQEVPGVDDELKLLVLALQNFRIYFDQWTPTINANHMLLYTNFVKSNAKMGKIIASMDMACVTRKAKTD
jgi:hypothetical protein